MSQISEFASDYVFYVFLRFLKTKKSFIMAFLELWLLLPSYDFVFSKLTTETLKTLEEDVECVWN